MVWSGPEVADWKIEVIAAEPIAEASCWIELREPLALLSRVGPVCETVAPPLVPRDQSGVVPVRWSKSPRTQPT